MTILHVVNVKLWLLYRSPKIYEVSPWMYLYKVFLTVLFPLHHFTQTCFADIPFNSNASVSIKQTVFLAHREIYDVKSLVEHSLSFMLTFWTALPPIVPGVLEISGLQQSVRMTANAEVRMLLCASKGIIETEMRRQREAWGWLMAAADPQWD